MTFRKHTGGGLIPQDSSLSEYEATCFFRCAAALSNDGVACTKRSPGRGSQGNCTLQTPNPCKRDAALREEEQLQYIQDNNIRVGPRRATVNDSDKDDNIGSICPFDRCSHVPACSGDQDFSTRSMLSLPCYAQARL
jgi:hypothetical protein